VLFRPLDHKGGSELGVEALFFKAIRCPTATTNSQPNKNLALVGSPGFPQLFPWFELNGPNEESSIW